MAAAVVVASGSVAKSSRLATTRLTLLTVASLVAGACGQTTKLPPAQPPKVVAGQAVAEPSPRAVKLVAISDFHGQLESRLSADSRALGGAAVLAAHLKRAVRDYPERNLLLVAGDHVGASPPVSGLLQDEPAMLWLELLANPHCREHDPRCNVVMSLGNHEFDRGLPELLRLIHGGPHPQGAGFRADYPGVSFPVVCANVARGPRRKPLLPAFVVRDLGGVKIGVIGVVTTATARHYSMRGNREIHFESEIPAVNRAADELRRQGVHAIVVLLHDGQNQPPFEGPTSPDAKVGDKIAALVGEFDEGIDVVVTAHTHGFTNAFTPNRGGRPVLVTQARAQGIAYADIALKIDATGEIVDKSAQIVTTAADVAPGDAPDLASAQLVQEARSKVAPLIDQVLTELPARLTDKPNRSGESLLGNLIADARRAATGTEIALCSASGIREALPQGTVTWGDAYATQPMGYTLVRISLTGKELKQLLEQQFEAARGPAPELFAVSGLSYEWDGQAESGERVRQLMVGELPYQPDRLYSVTVSSPMIAVTGLLKLPCNDCDAEYGEGELDALVEYLKRQTRPFQPTLTGRIRRVR